MTHPLEYHVVVRYPVQRVILAPLALLATLPLLLVSSSPAQNNGVTSISAHAVSAPSSSPRGSANSGVTSNKPLHPSKAPTTNNGQPQHNVATGVFYYSYIYAVPVPYPVSVDDNGAPGDTDPDYQGGPTVFDRRGSGAASYVPPSYHGPAHAQNQSSLDQASEDASVAQSGADPAPESPQSPTTLVFKDGHQLEVENYAIVAHTLYDLTPGRPRKIALADLDLPATEKQNDDRGVTFQLPPSIQGN